MKQCLAFCSKGITGLITSDEPELIKYKDGTEDLAWVGIRIDLSPYSNKTGEYWCSRNPKIIRKLSDFEYNSIMGFIKKNK